MPDWKPVWETDKELWGEGRQSWSKRRQRQKEIYREKFLEAVEGFGWREKYPDIDWDAILADRQRDINPATRLGLGLKYGRNWDEREVIDYVISETEKASKEAWRAEQQPKEVTVQPPEWMKNLPPEDMEEYGDLVADITRNAKRLEMELTPGDWQKINDFFGILLEKKGADPELAKVGLGDFLDWLDEDKGLAWMERKRIFLPFPQLMNEDLYQLLLEAKIAEEEARIPEAFSDLVNTAFNELPASLQRGFVEALGDKVMALRSKHVKETGKTLSDEDALARLTDEDIESARQIAVSAYTNEYGGGRGVDFSMLHEAATLQGMSDAQYMQSAFQSWKATLHPEYIRTRSNEQLWREFENSFLSPVGERSSLRGFVEADLAILSGEKKGEMTQPYEMVTSTKGEYPQGGAPFEAYGLQPVGKPKVGTGEPVGGYAAEEPITRDQALRYYIRSISGSPKERSYLQGFFNTFWNEFSSGSMRRVRTINDWQNYLKRQDLRSLLPAPKMPKTRFIR